MPFMHNALKLIFEKITMIEEIVQEKGSITQALDDEKLSKPAILMHLIAIAEQFQRLQNARWSMKSFQSLIKKT